MYAPRHRRFATGLVHGEVQYFAHDKQNSTRSRFKMCACAVRNNVLMVSFMRVQFFMRAGMRN